MNFVFLLLQGPFNQHVLTCCCHFQKSFKSSSTYIPCCFGCLPNLPCFVQSCSSCCFSCCCCRCFNQHVLTHRCRFQKSFESSSTYIPCCFGCLPNLPCFVQSCSSCCFSCCCRCCYWCGTMRTKIPLACRNTPTRISLPWRSNGAHFCDLQPWHNAPSSYCHPSCCRTRHYSWRGDCCQRAVRVQKRCCCHEEQQRSTMIMMTTTAANDAAVVLFEYLCSSST